MKRLLTALRRLFLLSLLAGGVYAASLTPFPRAALGPRDGPALAASRSWGYQLQSARPDRIAASIDMLVIDGQRQSSPPRTLATSEVERFRTRPDGSKRIVLAYLSIGEAENYRPYWWSHWAVLRPSWLGPENSTWKGNFRVRYWEDGWRRLIIHSTPSLLDRGIGTLFPHRKPYIDQILEAGFDGVYLDRVDAFYEWQKGRPDAEKEMMAFVAEVSDYARARRPGFLVVPQNGEELLRNANYRRKIDGIAKEDLLFGADHSTNDNPADSVAESLRHLSLARADRLPVFVVEYTDAPDQRQKALSRLRSLGFIVQFADRALKAVPELPDDGSTTPQPARPRPKG